MWTGSPSDLTIKLAMIVPAGEVVSPVTVNFSPA
jgi:hypothetical protein